LPLLIDRSCDVTYMVMHALGHNNGASLIYPSIQHYRSSYRST